MGNSVSGLPYEEVEKVAYDSYWELSDGKKTTEDATPVSIFKFAKKSDASNLDFAQHSLQKIKLMKHPKILSCLDSVDDEENIIMVTEKCTPILKWINLHAQKESPEDFHQIIRWGCRCLLEGLDFLHMRCNTIHANFSINSIFVTPDGDWKIGALDLLCKIGSFDDENFLKRYNQRLDRLYLSPERRQYDFPMAPSMDIYAFGVCIQKIYEKLNMEMPQEYSKYVKAMHRDDVAKRPRASQLLSSVLFKTEYTSMLDKVSELGTKMAVESIDLLNSLAAYDFSKVSSFICASKIIPSLAAAIRIGLRDFQKPDMRDSCRMILAAAVEVIIAISVANKINADTYTSTLGECMLEMWRLADRNIRSALLKSLKSVTPLITAEEVNKNIFDPLLAGFADSNSKMREDTLKNLVHLLDKLDTEVVRNKLLRCIVNLQNDKEPSIRTNATIFLGKLVNKLNDDTRIRVVYPAFVKSLRDPFVHCRVAALKSTSDCLSSIGPEILCTKMMPPIVICMYDPSPEVRDAAFTFVEKGMAILKEQHLQRKSNDIARAAHSNANNGTIGGLTSSNIGELSLKPPTANNDMSSMRSNTTLQSNGSTSGGSSSSGGLGLGGGVSSSNNNNSGGIGVGNAWENDDDDDLFGNINNMNQSNRSPPPKKKSSTMTNNRTAARVEKSGWDDDDDDDDWGEPLDEMSINDTGDGNGMTNISGGGGGWGDDNDDDLFGVADETANNNHNAVQSSTPSKSVLSIRSSPIKTSSKSTTSKKETGTLKLKGKKIAKKDDDDEWDTW